MVHGKVRKPTMTHTDGTKMKHSKERKHHRPTPRQFAIIVGAVVYGSLVFAPHANAIGGTGLKTNNSVSLSPLKQNDAKLEELNKTFALQKEKIEDKSKVVEKAKQEADKAVVTKEDVAKQVAELKAELEDLNDMFVHISSYAPNSAGNNYAAGNCTWYAKSRRPDLPNSMGNANMWYYSAAAQGFNVGLKAKVGAVATTTEGWAGHVAYVEKVSRDGSMVTISEMNYGGLYQMNTRTVPASDFKYIYEKP